MNNNVMINQARKLYTELHVALFARPLEKQPQLRRLERLLDGAYCRYQRRLNRCVVCYLHRLTDCERECRNPCGRLPWKTD